MSPEMVVSRFDIPKLETRLRLPHKAEASTAVTCFKLPFSQPSAQSLLPNLFATHEFHV